MPIFGKPQSPITKTPKSTVKPNPPSTQDNKTKEKPKSHETDHQTHSKSKKNRGKAIGIQLSGTELFKRYEQIRTTQLGPSNSSFCQIVSVVPIPKLERVERELVNMMVLSDIFKTNVHVFHNLPQEQYVVARTIAACASCFLNEDTMEAVKNHETRPLGHSKDVQCNLDELDETIKMMEGNAKYTHNPEMKNALATMKKHKMDKTTMTHEELKQIYKVLEKELQTDPDEENLEKFLLALQSSGYVDANTAEGMKKGKIGQTIVTAVKEVNPSVDESDGKPMTPLMVPKTFRDIKMEAMICDCIPKNSINLNKNTQEQLELLSRLDRVYMIPENAPYLKSGKKRKLSVSQEAQQLNSFFKKMSDQGKDGNKSKAAKTLTSSDCADLQSIGFMLYDIGKDIHLSGELLGDTLSNMSARNIITKEEAANARKRLQKIPGGTTVGGIRRDFVTTDTPDHDVGTKAAVDEGPEKDPMVIRCLGDVLVACSRHDATRKALSSHEQHCLYTAGFTGCLQNANWEKVKAGNRDKIGPISEIKFFKSDLYADVLKMMEGDPLVRHSKKKTKALDHLYCGWKTQTTLIVEELGEVYHTTTRHLALKPNHAKEILTFMKEHKMGVMEHHVQELAKKYTTEISAKDMARDIVACWEKDAHLVTTTNVQAPPPIQKCQAPPPRPVVTQIPPVSAPQPTALASNPPPVIPIQTTKERQPTSIANEGVYEVVRTSPTSLVHTHVPPQPPVSSTNASSVKASENRRSSRDTAAPSSAQHTADKDKESKTYATGREASTPLQATNKVNTEKTNAATAKEPPNKIIVEKEEHPVMQLLNDYAGQCFVQDDDMRGTATLDDITEGELKTDNGFSSRPGAARSTRAATLSSLRSKSYKSSYTLDPTGKQKYRSMIQSIKQIPGYERDKAKAEAVMMLNDAVGNNRGLDADELQKVIDAIGKEATVPKSVLPIFAAKLALSYNLSKEEAKHILNDLNAKAKKGYVTLDEMQEIINEHADKKFVTSQASFLKSKTIKSGLGTKKT